MTLPTFSLERTFLETIEDDVTSPLLMGVDEVGCGPWAGPLVACAVAFHPSTWKEIETHLPLNDSKKLSIKKRESLISPIKENALTGLGMASVKEIDTKGLAAAHRLAVHRAVEDLLKKTSKKHHPIIFMDGVREPKLDYPTHMIIRGDSKSCSIAAASILAKVTRDHMMHELSLAFPEYGWDTNAGYGTKRHQKALHTHGVTIHHRRSYAPIRVLLDTARARVQHA